MTSRAFFEPDEMPVPSYFVQGESLSTMKQEKWVESCSSFLKYSVITTEKS